MATLDEKITRVENNIAASLEAAAEMGAEVPEGANSDSLPGLIRSIPNGGGIWEDVTEAPPGVEITDGGTVTWNGDSDKLEKIARYSSGGNVSGWVKLSDVAPSYKYFTGGGEPDASKPISIGSYSQSSIDFDGNLVEVSTFGLVLPADNCHLDEYTGSFLYLRNENSMAIEVVCAVEEFTYWDTTFQKGLWVSFQHTDMSDDNIAHRYISEVRFNGYDGLTDAVKIKGDYLPSSVVQTDPEQEPSEGDVLTYTRSAGAVWLAAAPGGGDSTPGLFVVGIADMEEGTVTCTASEILEMANQGRPVVLRYPLGEPGSFMEYSLYRATSESVAFHAPADRFDNGDINIGMIVVHDGNHFYMDQIFINQEAEVETVYDWEGESSLTTEEIYEKSCMGKAVILRDTGDFEHEETTDYALWHSDASSAEFRSPVFISDDGEASVKIVRVATPNIVTREEKVVSVTSEGIAEALGYTPASEEEAKQLVVSFAYDANGSLVCTPGADEVFAAHRNGRTVVAVFEKTRYPLARATLTALDFDASIPIETGYKMIRLVESGSAYHYTGVIGDSKLDKNQGEENYGKVMGVNLKGEVVPVELQLPDSSGGVSSWNDLKDRPFYEGETGGDTLTWDGNTEGLVCVSNLFYKVSNALPTQDDVAGGVTAVFGGTLFDLPPDDFTISGGIIDLGPITIVSGDGVGVDYNGMVFPEAGTYFISGDSGRVYSLTIPGYAGFPSFKKLDKKFLPEHPHLWDEIEGKPTVMIGSDTLTWDGNSEGLTSINGMFFHVSDAVPSVEEVASGFYLKNAYTEMVGMADTLLTGSDLDMNDETGAMLGQFFVVVRNAEALGAPKTGIYLLDMGIMGGVNLAQTVIIPGYSGFVTEKLDPAYLPDTVAHLRGEVLYEGDLTLEYDEGDYALFGTCDKKIPLEVGVEYTVQVGDKSIKAVAQEPVSGVVQVYTSGSCGAIWQAGMLVFTYDNPASQENANMHVKLSAPELKDTLDPQYLPGDLIPAYTAEDEGKVLKIVGGVPTWVAQ